MFARRVISASPRLPSSCVPIAGLVLGFGAGATAGFDESSMSTFADVPASMSLRVSGRLLTELFMGSSVCACDDGSSTARPIWKGKRRDTKSQLLEIRRRQSVLLRKWQEDEEGWHALPSRAWPAFQPTPDQMKQDIEKRIRMNHCAYMPANTTKTQGVDRDCQELWFQVATTLVFYNLDAQRGLMIFEQLAHQGHIDSMVACGIILVEGLGDGVAPEEKKGIEWLQRAYQSGQSAQGCYELGTLYYTGVDDVLEENTHKAVQLFEKAIEISTKLDKHPHTASLYMLADCLLEGEGVDSVQVGRAIPLLMKAAEQGHRYSRQRIRELLARPE